MSVSLVIRWFPRHWGDGIRGLASVAQVLDFENEKRGGLAALQPRSALGPLHDRAAAEALGLLSVRTPGRTRARLGLQVGPRRRSGLLAGHAGLTCSGEAGVLRPSIMGWTALADRQAGRRDAANHTTFRGDGTGTPSKAARISGLGGTLFHSAEPCRLHWTAVPARVYDRCLPDVSVASCEERWGHMASP